MNKQGLVKGSVNSARRAGRRFDILVERATSVLPAIAGVLVLCLSASGAAGQATIYNAIPSPLPPNEISQCFQCAQVFELGDEVQFAGTARALKSVTVTMSDWAKHSDWPTYPSAGFTIPVTLKLYNVNAGPTVGSVIKSVTVNQTIPWRPETSAACGGDDAWQASDSNCYHGLAANITFDLSSQNVVVPNQIIYSLAINTESWGYAPIGVDGPYDSLNVGLLDSSPSYDNGGAPSVGLDVDPSSMFQYSTWTGEYCDGGSAGFGVFRFDAGCWGGYPNPTDTYGTISAEFDACDCLIGGVCYANGAANPSNQCQQCNSATSTSAFTNKLNGASCNDGNACTLGDKCIAGKCSGSPLNVNDQCSHSNPCTTASCNPAIGCVYINNTAPCSDNNACTSGDACSGGQCVGGAAVSCDDKNPCTADSCSASSGCAHTALADGTQCSDGTGNPASCTSGTCCSAALTSVAGVDAGLLSFVEGQCPSCPRSVTTHVKYVKCVKTATKFMRANRAITKKQQTAINKAAQKATVGQ